MTEITLFIEAHWESIVAVIWFTLCFYGYMFYSQRMARTTNCLSSVMHKYRQAWMEQMLTRDVRVSDTTALANLERSVAFFASSTMLIVAGLVTVLGSTDKVIDMVADVPFATDASRSEWEIKLLLLIGLFTYAFFKFTWSLRQYGFCSVMMGGAPNADAQVSERERKAISLRIAHVASLAANNFNLGLRTYYFSLAVLGWFINPWLFVALSGTIVWILYRREFKSRTLNELIMSRAEQSID
ncbi:DUF599 domain-containing protein [Sedimenticola thiotaurini]|uniref:Membrane protein n=1 Tax=Sedimenticola thiotaurini TaxID=1543721 RepID=A0A0F7JVH9_9GAMM|nr:DUF599 domain-containing protein [Sedimenticola thiotaurini]AKH19344.1 membrane protein [Sedimenticola thiotaurini]